MRPPWTGEEYQVRGGYATPGIGRRADLEFAVEESLATRLRGLVDGAVAELAQLVGEHVHDRVRGVHPGARPDVRLELRRDHQHVVRHVARPAWRERRGSRRHGCGPALAALLRLALLHLLALVLLA